MGTIASQITSLAIVYTTVYSDADQSKHESSALLAFLSGDSPGTGEFPAQMASNAENVSIWWRHHMNRLYIFLLTSVYTVSLHMSTLVVESHIATLLVNTTHAIFTCACFNSYPPGQNVRYFADDILKSIFLNEMICILIQISVKCVPEGPIDNKRALVKVMVWRRTGDKPLPNIQYFSVKK